MSATNHGGVPSQASARSVSASVFHSLFNSAIFLVALISSCVLSSRILPFPEVPVVSDKLDHLARRGDEYDVIFVGSSRVYFQIMPSVFDRTAAGQGLVVRSFNAGVAAMTPPEDGYLVDQILQRPHRRLRWAFIEVMALRPRSDPRFGTARLTYWHDWERTALLGKYFVRQCLAVHSSSSGVSVWDQAQVYEYAYLRWVTNVGLFAENFTNLGRGAALLGRKMSSKRAMHSEGGGVEEVGDGWTFPRQEKRMTEEMLAAYQSAYTNLLQSPQRFDIGDEVSEEALRRMVAKLAGNGVTPILIIPPTVAPKRFFPTDPSGHSQVLLDFSDPRKFPELFTPDHRLDEGHLNVAGSEIFTSALALRLAKLNSSREP